MEVGNESCNRDESGQGEIENDHTTSSSASHLTVKIQADFLIRLRSVSTFLFVHVCRSADV